MYRNQSLTIRLVGIFLAFGLIPATVLTVTTLDAANDNRASTAAQLEHAAEAIADKIDRNLFERYGDVQAFGLNTVLDEKESWYHQDNNAIAEAMNRYVDTYDLYALTILVDTQGKVVAVNSTDSNAKPLDTRYLYGKSFSEASWFQNVKAGNFTTRMPFSKPQNTVVTGTVIEDVHVDDDVKRVYPELDGRVLTFAALFIEMARLSHSGRTMPSSGWCRTS